MFGIRLDRRFLRLIPLIKKLNVITAISWGLESCSQRILKLYAKGTSVSSFKPILKAFSEAGVSNFVYVLFGLPLMQQRDIELTRSGLMDLMPYYEDIRLNWFLLNAHLPVYRQPQEYRVHIKDNFKMCDSIGVNVLGEYNISTKFYDFDATIDGRTLSRSEDFKRYKPVFDDFGPLMSMHELVCFFNSAETLLSFHSF